MIGKRSSDSLIDRALNPAFSDDSGTHIGALVADIGSAGVGQAKHVTLTLAAEAALMRAHAAAPCLGAGAEGVNR